MDRRDSKQIVINTELCVGCGSCLADCVGDMIRIEDGKAVITNGRCIICGHCFAVCPMHAINIAGWDTSDCDQLGSMTEFDPDRLLLAMKSRRSVRQFQDKPVPQKLVRKLIEAANYAPTAKNRQDVFFTVIQDKLDEVENKTLAVYRRALVEETRLTPLAKNMNLSDHRIFFNAPLAIVFSSRDVVNATIAATYVELLAESMGLGGFHCGYVIGGFRSDPELAGMLELPEGIPPVTCLVLGWPKVEYERLPPRREANVSWL